MASSLDFMKVPLPSIASSGTTTASLPTKPKQPINPQAPIAPANAVVTPPASVVPVTPSPGTPVIPQVRDVSTPAPTITPSSSTVASAPLKSGLSTAQASSIQALSAKPVDQWTDTDRKNWAYATNGAALPSAKPVVPNVSTPGATQPEPSPVPPSPSSPSSSANTVPVTPGQQAVTDAEKTYQESLKISPDELSTQADLDRIIESTKKAYSNTEDQAIPMQFITGQLASIERRANTLAEPLQSKLARMQAARTAALDASKFALTRADKIAETEKEAEKAKAEATAKAAEPFNVGDGQTVVRLNPETGKYETVFQAPKKPESMSDKYGTGIIGEYNFYADQEQKAGRQPMSFNEYSNMDANRKAQTLTGGMSSQQQSTFLNITNKYQADSIVQQGSQAANAVAIADQVLANPSSATNQLKSLYTLVKSLDPNSAVREGEIALAEQTQSYLGTFGNSLQRIFQGQPITADAAKQLAQATKDLANVWAASAQRRDQQYRSQAGVAGVGDAFNSYMSGFDRSYGQGGGQQSGASNDPLGLFGGGGFSSVPSTTVKGSPLVSNNPNPSKVIGGYDFTTYATDPNWGNAVNKTISRVPNFQSPAEITNYIRSVAPNSQMDGNNVMASAQKYGVDPRLIVAIAQHESKFGTLGAGAKTFNPGNVGNVDSGATVNRGNWQSGTDALAANISRRRLNNMA